MSDQEPTYGVHSPSFPNCELWSTLSPVTPTPISYALRDGVAICTMDDGKANALSEPMIDALVAAIERAEGEAAAMVLAGRKDRFCAGFDLRVMMTSPDAAKALLRRGSALLMRLYGAKVPIVMACTGHALAGGALVLLTGDVRVGARGAYKLGLNEVAIGMPVPVLAMELARDRLDPRELASATLHAQIYPPEDAARAGYLDVVVNEDEVLSRAASEATRLGALPKPAYVATKARLRGRTIAYVESSLEADMQSLLSPATA
jgi:enoyl-CoA hydratase